VESTKAAIKSLEKVSLRQDDENYFVTTTKEDYVVHSTSADNQIWKKHQSANHKTSIALGTANVQDPNRMKSFTKFSYGPHEGAKPSSLIKPHGTRFDLIEMADDHPFEWKKKNQEYHTTAELEKTEAGNAKALKHYAQDCHFLLGNDKNNDYQSIEKSTYLPFSTEAFPEMVKAKASEHIGLHLMTNEE
jgi:hypothetical protein